MNRAFVVTVIALTGVVLLEACTNRDVVGVEVGGVSVQPGLASLLEGQSLGFQAVVQDASGAPLSGATVTWTSDGSQVIAVDENGVVSAQAAGTATIRAEFRGVVGSAQITVLAAPELDLGRDTVVFRAALGAPAPPEVVVAVRNVGGGTIGGLGASVEYPPGQPAGWLMPTLEGSETPTDLRLTAVTSSLPIGTYSASVSVASPDDDDGPVHLPVLVTLTGLTVTESAGGSTVSEAGLNDSISVVLDTQPDSDVVVLVTSDDAGEVVADLSELVFTAGDWDQPQIVTLSGVDDIADDGDQATVVTVSVDDGRSDEAFAPIPDRSVSVTNIDDDDPGYTVTPTGGGTVVDEGASVDDFHVVLDVEPASTVTFRIVSSDPGEAVVSPSVLMFGTEDWSLPQQVTVTGVDDALVDGDQSTLVTVSIDPDASDDAFDELPDDSVLVTTEDDDGAGFTVTETGGTTTVTEIGSTDEVTVVLTAQPESDVVIDITTSDPGEVTASPPSLTFSATDWNAAQTVLMRGVDDDLPDGSQVTSVTLSIDDEASDEAFASVPDQDVLVTTIDDDRAGFTVSETGGETVVTEAGGTDRIAVNLNAAPASSVVLRVVSSDLTEATVSPETLTFTATDWRLGRFVTVRGVDDKLLDGDATTAIEFKIDMDASDEAFDEVGEAIVLATTIDDDVPGFTVNTGGVLLTVTEAGGEESFTVVLDAQPFSDVVLSVSADDPTELSALPATLSFTASGWNTPQTVTVRGIDDLVQDGDQTTPVILEVVSDGDFLGVPEQAVPVVTLDDDAVGVTITETDASTAVGEAGSTDEFTVVLESRPAADVVVRAASDATSGIVVQPESLTFTPEDWTVPKQIAVIAIDDDIDNGSRFAEVVVSVDPASPDLAYRAVPEQTVLVSIADDDEAAVDIAPSGAALVVTEGGSTSEMSVVLAAQPISNVVVTIQSEDVGEVLASPSSLTFSPADWAIPQTVTLAGVDDAWIDATQVTEVLVSVDPSLSDDAFDSVAEQSLLVTTLDDDEAGFVLGGTGSTLTVEESGTSSASFSIALTARPVGSVVFDLTAAMPDEVSLDATTVEFTSSTWNAPRTIAVNGVNDWLVDGTQTSAVSVSVDPSGSDDAFDLVAPQSILIATTDDDVADVRLTETGGSTIVDEAGRLDSLFVRLEAQPTLGVVVTATSGDLGEIVIAPAALAFDPSNWAVDQLVTVRGIDDTPVDGPAETTLTFESVPGLSDDAFDAISRSVLSVTLDDDVAGFAVTETSGSTSVPESGTRADYLSVVLTGEPVGSVTIRLTVEDPTEVTLDLTALTFTSATWAVPQTVTVFGVDDGMDDGSQRTTIAIFVDRPASDEQFGSVPAQAVLVTTTELEGRPSSSGAGS